MQLVDVRAETVLSGAIADLASGPQVNTAIRQGFLRCPLVHAFAQKAIKLLTQQLATIEDRVQPKMFGVAEDQKSTKIAAEEIDKAAGQPFAKSVSSDEKGALSTLRVTAQSPFFCAIGAVQTVTEGFDCPEVSVIAYASATTAVLFLAQTVDGATRATTTERQDQRLLPAQILIPFARRCGPPSPRPWSGTSTSSRLPTTRNRRSTATAARPPAEPVCGPSPEGHDR